MHTQSIHFGVITVSDRSARGERDDRSGTLAQSMLSELGTVSSYAVVPDGLASVQDAIHDAMKAGATVILTTGGTGITRRDFTPQAVSGILSYQTPGIPALIQSESRVSTAALSRSIAGVIDDGVTRAFVVCLPGSPNAVAEGIHTLRPLFAHIDDQLHDGDHEPALGEHAEHSSRAEHSPHAEPLHHHEHELPSPSANPHHHFSGHAAATFALQHHHSATLHAGEVVLSDVTSSPIDMAHLEQIVRDDAAGAVLSFCGRVRNHDEGESVTSIDYSAHPSAPDTLAAIAADVAREHAAYKIAVQHRYGHLNIGDIALGATVSAAHRQDAFQALEALIERVKMELPIWKKQTFTDGSSQWSGMA
ncbi:MAG: molybdenum cofactor biosynthesis protein MoaE [Actinomycetaceae bacterium]|nr:molybdenum cofactor biosynthesis protein MoaE [Arcanobacterium sp.]MDD7687029.1 molybdenum cofactor biosynthesis protein MoaE [Actinomycetaceae bacterium]MDY5273314.1 molybdenum cofactor biosynthesis protein MoaE [Arcanobacterium sp.]